jgi:hypothetical protein
MASHKATQREVMETVSFPAQNFCPVFSCFAIEDFQLIRSTEAISATYGSSGN